VLVALSRVLAPVEAGVLRLTSIAGNAATCSNEQDMLRSLFVVKIEAMQVMVMAMYMKRDLEKRPMYMKRDQEKKSTHSCATWAMQVVLVAAMRCPSAAAAQTLVPAMQARLDLTVAEVARRLLLPKLGAILRPILERMVPPAVLAGGVAKTGDGAGGGGGGNSWAVQRGGSGTGAEEAWGWKVLVALRWSLAHHVEIRRRETRLKTVEGLLASYCHHQAERRRQVNQKRLADSAVMRHQAQARHLETQVAICKWIRLQHTATHYNTP